MNEEIMKACGFGEQVQRMKDGRCAWCGVPINLTHFRDDLSRKEWHISGMCQHCQDAAFAAEPVENQYDKEEGRSGEPPDADRDDPRQLR
jgi:hypothetical protein